MLFLRVLWLLTLTVFTAPLWLFSDRGAEWLGQKWDILLHDLDTHRKR
jgi:hypothetical protein